jgi:hypothetical protein
MGPDYELKMLRRENKGQQEWETNLPSMPK